MTDDTPIQHYVAELQQAWQGLMLLEQQPQQAEPRLSTLGQMLEAAIHSSVLNAGRQLAQRGVPGASPFMDAYSCIVHEFSNPVGGSGGFQLILVNESRAKLLRPVMFYTLASFLTQLTSAGEPDLARGMIGGGPDRRPPRAAFLNLVQQVHANSQAIREVILTDPYILLDKGEEGETGGYEGTIAYLQALRLESNSNFVLRITPALSVITIR